MSHQSKKSSGILSVFPHAILKICFLMAAFALSLGCFSSQSYALEYYSYSYIDKNGSVEEKTYSKSNSSVSYNDSNGTANAYSSVDINSSGNLEGHAYVSTTNYNNSLLISAATTKSIYTETFSLDNSSCPPNVVCSPSVQVGLHQSGMFSLTSSTGTQLTYGFGDYLFTFVLSVNGNTLNDVAPRAQLTGPGGYESDIVVNLKDEGSGKGSFDYNVSFDVVNSSALIENLLVSAQTYGVEGMSFLDTANSFHATLTPAEGYMLVGESGRMIGSTEPNNSVPVPEPSSLVLLGLGFAGLGIVRRRKS
ncbi:MAG: PEP-CTERM sorting domain-containing protein [Geobacteraceae bacterium]|nr:PEP-CTERM sorting domain-containing protein [Geobacteraceae bacterium]